MGILSKLFKKKVEAPHNDQAVLVYLDGQGLSEEVYSEYDTSTLEDQLMEVIELNSLGKFDGNEFGQGEAILFMYGPDAEALFTGIESILRAYPLCQKARVVIRQGGPGAPQREVHL